MSFAWPIALTRARARCAGPARLPRRAAAAQAVRRPLHEPRSPRERRRRLTTLATPRPAVLTLLALSALVVGMARPQVAVAVPRQEATVILAMDSSGSMTATDVQPDRMTAAREAASSFVEGLPERLPRRRRLLLQRGRRRRAADRRPRRGAARAERTPGRQRHRPRRRDRPLGRPRRHEPRRGSWPAATGARRDARRRPAPLGRREHDRRLRAARGGTEGEGRRASPSTRSPSAPMQAPWRAPTATAASGRSASRRTRRLSRVAELTGGKFFEAADQSALKSVYDEIGSQVGVEHKQRELTVFFTAAGAALLLLGGALSTLWFGRIP